MPEIVVTVKNKMAVGDGSVIVCNNSDYVVRFALDSEWDALALRTMRIVYDSYSHTDIAFSGDTVALPTIIDRTSIGIGLYSGDIHTSTCAMFDCERSVMGNNSHAVAPPSSDVYNEIVEMINDGRLKGDKGADGTNGADGANGADGVTFTPSVDSAGNLSWTNDGGLSNPATVNIKGADGAPGKDGSDASVTAENIQSALGYAPVKDVQVAGTSVMTDGVANVPIASKTKPGVIMVGNAQNSGMYIGNDGNCYISYAIQPEIDDRSAERKTIVCANLDYAVKAAMCDGKGAAWTDAEQKAARERMGIPGGYELIEEITIAEGNVSVIIRDVDRLCSAKFVIICPPTESIIKANAVLFFGDASKPEYIYLFGEIAPSKVGVYRHITLEAELRNNYWRAYKTAENETPNMYPNGSWTTHIVETAPSRLMQLPSSNLDAIRKITFKAYPTGTYIPVGTKITIYGVRA